jgi:hypothetical protein
MVSTRTTPGEPGEAVESMTEREELEYLVNTVLGKGGKEHPILLSCTHHGLDTVLDLMCFGDVKGMHYMDKDGTIIPLQSGHIGLIIQFREFEKQERGVKVKWTDYTRVEFNDYRGNTFRQENQTTAMTADRNGNVAVTTMRTTITPLQEFEKGIRRNKGAYLTLKDDKAWDSWRRSTIATARTHKCEEVFDPLYKPTTWERTSCKRTSSITMHRRFTPSWQRTQLLPRVLTSNPSTSSPTSPLLDSELVTQGGRVHDIVSFCIGRTKYGSTKTWSPRRTTSRRASSSRCFETRFLECRNCTPLRYKRNTIRSEDS